jgi:hypothetical protein
MTGGSARPTSNWDMNTDLGDHRVTALKSLNAIPTIENTGAGGGGSRLPTWWGPRVEGVGVAIGTRLAFGNCLYNSPTLVSRLRTFGPVTLI